MFVLMNDKKNAVGQSELIINNQHNFEKQYNCGDVKELL